MSSIMKVVGLCIFTVSCSLVADKPDNSKQDRVENIPKDNDTDIESDQPNNGTNGEAEQEFNPANCPSTSLVMPEDMGIASLVGYINSLPMPMTASCLLHYLPKPLRVDATSDNASAQPAVGRENPRLFFKVGKLYISIALTNTGSTRFEVSEIVSATRAVKAEIGFPIRKPLTDFQPFRRAQLADQATTCSVCHRGEVQAGEGFPIGAFESEMIRPIPRLDVDLDSLKSLAQNCTSQDLGGQLRCEILDIITGENGAIPYEFPVEIPTRMPQ